VIKDLEAEQASRTNGANKISRSWPPVSSTTDSDDDDVNDDSLTEEEKEQAIAPQPQPQAPPANTTAAAQVSTAESEKEMKGLYGQQPLSERTEKQISELLPQMVGKDLAALVAKAVETEVQTHMGASLSEERLTQMLEPLLATALPKVFLRERSLLEPIIRRSVVEIASPLLKERIDQFVREQTDAVRTILSDMVREQLGSIEGLVKKEIQQAVAKQTSEMVEALVLVAVREQVEQAVQGFVPALAEEQIKAEITRLTRAA
jgi:hypothetical protein